MSVWATALITIGSLLIGWFLNEVSQSRRNTAEVVRRRADFQRQTLVDLQEAAGGLVGTAGEAHAEMAEASRAGEPWGSHAIDRGTFGSFYEYWTAVVRRATRVDDQDLREVSERLAHLAQQCVMYSTTEAEAVALMEEIPRLMSMVMTLSGDRLRSLT